MAQLARKGRVEGNYEDLLPENMLQISRFSQRFLIRLQFYFGFLDLVVVKCSDVSEGCTAFLSRTIKLPYFDAPVTDGNIYLQYSAP
jgi:hypothetical protein